MAVEKQKQHIQDSLNKIHPKIDTSLTAGASQDSTIAKTKTDSLSGAIIQDTSGKEQLIEVENKLLKITFSNKGGQPQKIEIKKYKTFDGKPLILQDGQFNRCQ